jgi:hypothetical protein
MSVSPSRRRLLQAAVLSPVLSPVVAACTSGPSKPKRIDPDVALRTAAVARERELVDRYRAAAASSSSDVATRIAGLAEEHEEHLRALGGAAAPPPRPPTPRVPTRALLATPVRGAGAAHAAGALHASRPLAAVLASLAACEASHLVVLA